MLRVFSEHFFGMSKKKQASVPTAWLPGVLGVSLATTHFIFTTSHIPPLFNVGTTPDVTFFFLLLWIWPFKNDQFATVQSWTIPRATRLDHEWTLRVESLCGSNSPASFLANSSLLNDPMDWVAKLLSTVFFYRSILIFKMPPMLFSR